MKNLTKTEVIFLLHTMPLHLKPGSYPEFLKLLKLYALGVLTLADVEELVEDMKAPEAPDSVFEHLG